MFSRSTQKQDKNSYVAWWRDKSSSTKCYSHLDNNGNLSAKNNAKKPLISILTPTYNTPTLLLWKTASSVFKQKYKHWQWVIVDDSSPSFWLTFCLRLLSLHKKITVILEKTNKHISLTTNIAASHAKGEYLAFLDHDDELTEDALSTMVFAINKTDADFLYSDEDFIDINDHYDSAHFKTDFNQDLLFNHNYITHFSLVKKSLFDEIGGLRSEFDGAQDYDFVLRVSESTTKICHISDILYHWRRTEMSTSANHSHKPYTHERGKLALQQSLIRQNIEADVIDANMPNFFHVKRKLKTYPKVSIIIPFKDQSLLLRQVIDSIIHITAYSNYEIICVSNNSVENDTYITMDNLKNENRKKGRLYFYQHDIDFNFSKLVNFGVEKSSGEHIILMNNDIKVLNSYWLEAMLVHSQREDVAAVGAKLFYPDNTIQHAGIAIGLGKGVKGGASAGHIHQGLPYYSKGYYNRLNTIQSISAVTAAMMMVKKSIYNELNGFDESEFAVAFNDVDFCLRAISNGYKNIYTPYAQAYHYESISRGHDDDGEKLQRLNKEKQALRQRHKSWFDSHDPYYNKQLDYDCDDFTVAKKYEPLC